MGTYSTINGIKMWHDDMGEGEPLVILHPGGFGSDVMVANAAELAKHFHVYLVDRRGHGRTPDPEGDYTYELMADDMIAFMEQVVGGPARLMGVSDGAVVALTVAHKRPDLVERLICVAGVYHNSGWHDGAIDPMTNPPQMMVDMYAQVSPDGKNHHAVVLKKLDKMHAAGPTLSNEDLHKVTCRSMVMVGDDDEVRLEHAVDFYLGLPNGELAIIPRTSHALLGEKPELCNQIIHDFFTLDENPTFAPLRRQPQK